MLLDTVAGVYFLFNTGFNDLLPKKSHHLIIFSKNSLLFLGSFSKLKTLLTHFQLQCFVWSMEVGNKCAK